MSSDLRRFSPFFTVALAITAVGLTGCQDGPMYALKTVNPYYVLNEWKADEAYGVTDHQRMSQLADLADSIHEMSAEEQKTWFEHLKNIGETDPSPEMRRLVVRAARNLDGTMAMPLIETGLDDDSMKVRMEACRSLGVRGGDQEARLLAATLGTETNLDVKQAAIRALGEHQNATAIDSLRVALNDRNPATRTLAVESLRGSTGKDYGDDPEVWIAALEGKPTEETPTRFADRLRSFF